MVLAIEKIRNNNSEEIEQCCIEGKVWRRYCLVKVDEDFGKKLGK